MVIVKADCQTAKFSGYTACSIRMNVGIGHQCTLNMYFLVFSVLAR